MLPVDISTLGAFLLAVTALVLSPGPDTLIILRYTLSSGPRVGLMAVAGVQTGLVVHTLLAVFGVSVLIATSPLLYKMVAAAGAIYLAWIGVQGFRDGGMLNISGDKPAVSGIKAYRDAIACNVLNPKVVLMFIALLPNFVDPERGNISGQMITFGLSLIILNSLWQAPLALAAEAIRRWLLNPLTYKLVTRGTGVLLLAIALMMIYENFFV